MLNMDAMSVASAIWIIAEATDNPKDNRIVEIIDLLDGSKAMIVINLN